MDLEYFLAEIVEVIHGDDVLVSRGDGTAGKLLEHVGGLLPQSVLHVWVPDQGVAGPCEGGCRSLVAGCHHVRELERHGDGQYPQFMVYGARDDDSHGP